MIGLDMSPCRDRPPDCAFYGMHQTEIQIVGEAFRLPLL